MRVGVTGHQDLGSPDDVVWVAAQLRAQVARSELTVGVSSLAIGADQLYASLLREHGKPYTVVVPCHQYERTFTTAQDLATYRALLAGAATVIPMPFGEPSEKAFWEAGKRVAELSERLIAVWNGRPAKGLGGTGDVVRYSLEQGRHVTHLNPSTRQVAQLGDGQSVG